MKKFRVSNIRFHSALPYRVLSSQEFVQYEEHTPIDNAHGLTLGKFELAHIPITEYAVHGGYVGIDFGLAAKEKIDSIMLFAGCDIKKIRTLYLDDASSSAVALIKLLLLEKWKVSPRMIRVPHHDLEAAIGPDSGSLIIGNRAINWHGRFPVEIDPSTSWYELTGLPFVYSVWATRPGFLDRDDVNLFQELFHKCTAARSFIAQDFSSELEIPESRSSEHITKTVQYYLDDSCREGMREFLKRSARHRLLPQAEYQSVMYNIINRSSMGIPRRRSTDTLLQDRVDGKRLAISDCVRLARRADLADLALATELLHTREAPPRRLFVQLEAEVDEEGTLLEAAPTIQPYVDRIGLRILDPFLLNLKTLEKVVQQVNLRYGVSVEALSSDQLSAILKSSGKPLEEVIARLVAAGLHSIRPLPEKEMGLGNFCEDRRPANFYLQSIRWLNRFGGSPSLALLLSTDHSWEDRLSQLAEIRLLEDETPGISSLYLKTEPALNSIQGSELRMRMFMLTRLFMDNLPTIQAEWDPALPSAGLFAMSTGITGIRMQIEKEHGALIEYPMLQQRLASLGITARTPPHNLTH